MERIEGRPVLRSVPDAWAAAPETHGRALEELVDALVAIHAVDWRACGLGDLAHDDDYLSRQLTRWLTQLDSYGGRDLPAAREVADWLDDPPPGRPAERPVPRRLQARQRAVRAERPARAAGRRGLGDGGHRRPARRPGLGAHLPPRARGHPAPGHGQGADVRRRPASRPPYAGRAVRGRLGPRHVTAIGWYDVFARWKLALVLEGSYAKFQRGLSDKPIHEFFGTQVDLLLDSAATIIERGDAT